MKTIATIYLTFLTAMFALVVAGCGGGDIQDCDCDECVCSCPVVQVGTPEVL